jgi:hypothetical protein
MPYVMVSLYDSYNRTSCITRSCFGPSCLRVSLSPFTLSFPIELRTVTGQVVEKKSELQEVLASITAANLEQQTLGQSIGAAQSQLTALRTQLDGYEEKKIQLERQLAALGNLDFQLPFISRRTSVVYETVAPFVKLQIRSSIYSCTRVARLRSWP